MSDMGFRGRPQFWLMGLVHGHHDVVVHKADKEYETNAGIAIVVPVDKIVEVLNRPMVKQQDDKELEERRKKKLPTLDSVEESKRVFTKSDFQDALKKVSKRKPAPRSS